MPISWGTNFGGGMVTLTANIKVNNTVLTDTINGLIEGQPLDSTFKQYEINYLENPVGDQDSAIRNQMDSPLFFRVIAYMESSYKHFDWSLWAEPGDSMFPIESDDGGFGLMQLTDPRPTYEQIWNYRSNVDAAVDLVKDKLAQATAYPNYVRTAGCNLPPVLNSDGTVKYYRCFPIQPMSPDATDFDSYGLKMDTYSLYNSGWHYWKWIPGDKGIAGDWVQRVDPEALNYKHTGSAYADKADEIESNPPNDF